jgi:CBS domain-containing protein
MTSTSTASTPRSDRPAAPAQLGYSIATGSDARRVPVVDADGTLLGIVAITADMAGFCGAS